MRILVAPDKFAGTLTAPQAAHAIAAGWRRTAPDVECTALPMADGGPGFVDALHAVLDGELQAVTVAGPDGAPAPVTLLLDGETAYLESAQACGLHLLDPLDPWHASTAGVGEALAAAVDAGARTIVVGLGGSGTNDGGAGFLGALGATADRPLDGGPEALRGITSVDLAPARARLDGVRIIAATDVEVPLLGMFGATKTFGPQKGLSDPDIIAVDGLLDAFVVAVCGRTPAERRIADAKGAGAAGGLGFALLLLGAEVIPGVQLVADAVGLGEACREHDLIVTGEGTYDHTSRSGKVVHGVASVAADSARPCIALAGRVTVGAREMRAMGVESAYAMVDLVGEQSSLSEPYEALATLAARVARTWSA